MYFDQISIFIILFIVSPNRLKVEKKSLIRRSFTSGEKIQKEVFLLLFILNIFKKHPHGKVILLKFKKNFNIYQHGRKLFIFLPYI